MITTKLTKKQAYLWKQTNNGWEEIRNPWDSMDDISRFLPDCAYTTFRTYRHDYMLQPDSQKERLQQTCHLSQKDINIDFEAIRKGLRGILQSKNDYPDWRIRVSIDIQKNIGETYLSVGPLSVPEPEDYQNGINVDIIRMSRDNPKAKLSAFIKSTIEIKKKIGRDIKEIIMVDDTGRMLEGISSNVIIISDNTIWTAEEGVLSGITRGLVLDIIRDSGFAVCFKGFPIGDLKKCQEIFITSASRAVLPVSRVDDLWISKKTPGPITETIMKKLNNLLEVKLEKI